MCEDSEQGARSKPDPDRLSYAEDLRFRSANRQQTLTPRLLRRTGGLRPTVGESNEYNGFTQQSSPAALDGGGSAAHRMRTRRGRDYRLVRFFRDSMGAWRDRIYLRADSPRPALHRLADA
jgi:hypothetical protein